MKIIYLSLILITLLIIIGGFIYSIVRIAIKHSFEANGDNIKIKIKEAVKSALIEEEFKKRNR